MNVRKLARHVVLSGAIAVGTLGIAATSASAGDNGGCGAGFTESTLGELTTYAFDTYGVAVDFSAVDKNDDTLVCWHPIGRTCPCGANAINVIDDNANATHD